MSKQDITFPSKYDKTLLIPIDRTRERQNLNIEAGYCSRTLHLVYLRCDLANFQDKTNRIIQRCLTIHNF